MDSSLSFHSYFDHALCCIGEESLASILIAIFPFHDKTPELTPALVDTMTLVVRMFDEYLLPLHCVCEHFFPQQITPLKTTFDNRSMY